MAGLCSCLTSCLTWGVQHWSLLAIGWSWVLVLRRRSLGELLPVDITWGREVSCGPMCWTWPSHHEGSGLTPGWSTKTLPATQLRRKGREKNKNKKTNRQNPSTNGKSKPVQTKSLKEACTYTLTKREKGKKYIY